MKAEIAAIILLVFGNTLLAHDSGAGQSVNNDQFANGPTAWNVSTAARQDVANERKRKSASAHVFSQRRREAMGMDTGDPKAPSALNWVLAHPEFSQLRIEEQRQTLAHAAYVAAISGDGAAGHQRIVRAIELGHEQPDAWHLRLALEADHSDKTAAATSLLHLVRKWPAMIHELDNTLVARTALQAPLEAETSRELIVAIVSSGWNNHGLGTSSLQYRLALMHLDRGDRDAVRRVLPELGDNPESVILIRSDIRLDGLYDRDDEAFDVLKAANRQLARLQVAANKQTDDLMIRVYLSHALLTLGRHEEAITLANEVEDNLQRSTSRKPAYRDAHEANWIFNYRAVALRRLGRLDEAQADLSRGAAMNEHGIANVSQVLNLGQFLCSRGLPSEARAAIDVAGTMSGYGRLVQMKVQHCAAIQQEDRVAAEQAVTYLRDNRDETPGPWIDALIRENRLDEAARALAEALADTSIRSEMLLDMQQYIAVEPLPGAATLRVNWQQLLERDDVRQAIARVGRIERHEIYGQIEY